MRNPRFHILIILIIALVLRLWTAFFSRVSPAFDAAGYDASAVSILQGGGYGGEGRPSAFKEPFYAFFLAGIYYFFGHNYLAVKIIQALLGLLICLFVILIGTETFNAKVGMLAGFLASINPSFIKATEQLITETLFTFLLISIIFFTLRLVREFKIKIAILVGLLFGMGTLTRSVLLPFAVLAFTALYFIQRKKYLLKNLFYIFSIMFICFFVVILPWTIRNWIHFHEFIPISTNVGVNMYSCFFPPEGKLLGLNTSDDNTRLAESLSSEAARSRFLLHKTIERLKNTSFKYLLKLEFLKILFFWTPFDWELIGGGKYNIFFGFIFPFFFVSVLCLLNKFKELIFIYLPLIYSQILSLLAYGSPRLRLPIEPYIILFASFGIWSFWEKFRQRRLIIIPLVFTGWLFVNISIYLHYLDIKLIIKKIIW